MEQNTTVVATITHHDIIHIFVGYKAQLTNIKMAKAVVALNPRLFQHMNIQKEKDYYKIYMHINWNVLSECQKMKKLNKSEEREINFCQNLCRRSTNPHQQMLREAKK